MILKNTIRSKRRLFKNTPETGELRMLHSPNSMSFITDRGTYPEPNGPASDGIIALSFNKPLLVLVDFGDGTRTTYGTVPAIDSDGYLHHRFTLRQKGSSLLPGGFNAWEHPHHIYADWTTEAPTEHTVTIYYSGPEMTKISINEQRLPVQDFFFGFSQHPNLEQFSLISVTAGPVGNTFVALDLLNVHYCTRLVQLNISRCFNETSPYFGAIPEQLLSRPLRVLGFGDPGFEDKTFRDSNMDKIVRCKDTLETMSINYRIDEVNEFDPINGVNDPALPPNFVELTNLRSIYFGTTNYNETPALVNSMPWLTKVTTRGTSTTTGWGDLSNLTELVALEYDANPNLSPVVPAWLANTLKLKLISLQSSYRTTRPGAIDEMIRNLYERIIPLAPMLGVPEDPYRNVNFQCHYSVPGDATSVPSGTFQAPAGYVQAAEGIPGNNGINIGDDPLCTMSKERLWVLENQYGWICTFNE